MAGIKKQFPRLQRTPKTAEQRKEQAKECMSQKRAAESEIDKEMRLKKQKNYNEKRIAESQILCEICKTSNHRCRKCKNTVCNFCGERDPSSENEMHIMHKENDTRCKVGEIEIERQRRLNRQKEYEHNRFTKTRERAKKVQEVREKRMAESEKEKERRLNNQKEYEHEKRLAESEKEKERRLTQDKEYQSRKRSEESEKEKERRLTQDKEYQRQNRRQPIKDWEQQLIDKASLTHICTSECRYRPK